MTRLNETAAHNYRGVAFEVGPRTDGTPGIVWRIRQHDHLGRETSPRESQGAFYNGCADHPEGAYEWARRACCKWIDRSTT
jgi:hypothetical protein